jgi:acyl carrier protein
MPRDQVLAGITEIRGGVAGINRADITPETSLADLGIDSLMMVEVVVAAEDRFGLLINDDDWHTSTARLRASSSAAAAARCATARITDGARMWSVIVPGAGRRPSSSPGRSDSGPHGDRP